MEYSHARHEGRSPPDRYGCSGSVRPLPGTTQVPYWVDQRSVRSDRGARARFWVLCSMVIHVFALWVTVTSWISLHRIVVRLVRAEVDDDEKPNLAGGGVA